MNGNFSIASTCSSGCRSPHCTGDASIFGFRAPRRAPRIPIFLLLDGSALQAQREGSRTHDQGTAIRTTADPLDGLDTPQEGGGSGNVHEDLPQRFFPSLHRGTSADFHFDRRLREQTSPVPPMGEAQYARFKPGRTRPHSSLVDNRRSDRSAASNVNRGSLFPVDETLRIMLEHEIVEVDDGVPMRSAHGVAVCLTGMHLSVLSGTG